MTAILGVPCGLKSRKSREATNLVLGRVLDRFPMDFARLRSRVTIIEPLPLEEAKDGTQGLASIFAADGQGGFESLCCNYSWEFDDVAYVEIKINERGGNLVATIAHELGHACTRGIDIDRRCAPDMEWGAEAAADWYACKWGFGNEMTIAGVNRRIGHHGAHPGERIELSEVGMFVMTRNHVYRQVGPACKFGVEDIYDDVTAPIGKPALKASKSKRKQPKKKGWSG